MISLLLSHVRHDGLAKMCIHIAAIFLLGGGRVLGAEGVAATTNVISATDARITELRKEVRGLHQELQQLTRTLNLSSTGGVSQTRGVQRQISDKKRAIADRERDLARATARPPSDSKSVESGLTAAQHQALDEIADVWKSGKTAKAIAAWKEWLKNIAPSLSGEKKEFQRFAAWIARKAAGEPEERAQIERILMNAAEEKTSSGD